MSVVSLHDPKEIRDAAGRCPTCGRQGVTWTRERILEAIAEWSRLHGTAPSADAWVNAGHGHPSNHTVRQMFGTLAAAREAAGVRLLRKNSPGDWDRRTVKDAIWRWTFLHGEPPRQVQWMSPQPGWPTSAVVRRLFGGWNAAIVAAGYPPRRPRRAVDGYRRVAGATLRNREAKAAA